MLLRRARAANLTCSRIEHGTEPVVLVVEWINALPKTVAASYMSVGFLSTHICRGSGTH